MPRRATPLVADQYYHFFNRGNNRQVVFYERDNYLFFLRGMKKYLREQMDILAYCLMPTHYHFLVRMRGLKQPARQAGAGNEENSEVLKTSEFCAARADLEVSKAVSLAMQKFGISYTKAINKRFDRVGALFQGQFKCKPIRQYNHLLNLCIYIHANPVKDGLATLPENWEFSNYPEWLSLRPGTLVNREFIAEHFGSPEDYRLMVMDYLQTRVLPKDLIRYLQELGA